MKNRLGYSFFKKNSILKVISFCSFQEYSVEPCGFWGGTYDHWVLGGPKEAFTSWGFLFFWNKSCLPYWPWHNISFGDGLAERQHTQYIQQRAKAQTVRVLIPALLLTIRGPVGRFPNHCVLGLLIRGSMTRTWGRWGHLHLLGLVWGLKDTCEPLRKGQAHRGIREMQALYTNFTFIMYTCVQLCLKFEKRQTSPTLHHIYNLL